MNGGAPSAELYDLNASQSEEHNVAGEQRDVTRRLSAKLTQWRNTLP
jgi:hypothetical protein